MLYFNHGLLLPTQSGWTQTLHWTLLLPLTTLHILQPYVSGTYSTTGPIVNNNKTKQQLSGYLLACSCPSRVAARCEKMSRIKAVRSHTRQVGPPSAAVLEKARSRLRSCPGLSSSSNITVSTCQAAIQEFN